MVEPVVGSERSESTQSVRKREEDLRGRIAPYIQIAQLAEVRRQVELEAFPCTLERHSANEHSGEDDVWEGCSEVHDLEVARKKKQIGGARDFQQQLLNIDVLYLSRRFHALNETYTNNDPRC